MSENEQKKIFKRNLQRYLSEKNKTQKEVADAIGVSPQTFNTWMQGIALPRMGKVQLLADYFAINKSDLIEDKPHQEAFAALTPSEKEHMINYRRLDDIDKGKVDERIEMLLEDDKYKKEMATA